MVKANTPDNFRRADRAKQSRSQLKLINNGFITGKQDALFEVLDAY